MVEHTVILDLIGGTKTLSCEALNIKNIEYPHDKVTAEGIKETLLKYKHLKEEETKFDVIIIDNRPPSQNFNEQRAEESKNYKEKRNALKPDKM